MLPILFLPLQCPALLHDRRVHPLLQGHLFPRPGEVFMGLASPAFPFAEPFPSPLAGKGEERACPARGWHYGALPTLLSVNAELAYSHCISGQFCTGITPLSHSSTLLNCRRLLSHCPPLPVAGHLGPWMSPCYLTITAARVPTPLNASATGFRWATGRESL